MCNTKNYGCEELAKKWEEENIEYDSLPDCLKNIVEKFLNNNKNDISKLIGEFDKDGILGDNFNLIFKTGDLSHRKDNRLAETNVSKDWKTYTIIIDMSKNANHTNLSLYSTIAHEAVHAILFFRLYSEHPNFASTYGNDYSSLNFNDVFNLYAEEFPNNLQGENPGTHQHNLMAEKVTSLMAKTIKEMDNSKNSDKFYWELAWGGLKETDVWNEFILEAALDSSWNLSKEDSGFPYDTNKQTLTYIEQTCYYESEFDAIKSKGNEIINESGKCIQTVNNFNNYYVNFDRLYTTKSITYTKR